MPLGGLGTGQEAPAERSSPTDLHSRPPPPERRRRWIPNREPSALETRGRLGRLVGAEFLSMLRTQHALGRPGPTPGAGDGIAGQTTVPRARAHATIQWLRTSRVSLFYAVFTPCRCQFMGRSHQDAGTPRKHSEDPSSSRGRASRPANVPRAARSSSVAPPRTAGTARGRREMPRSRRGRLQTAWCAGRPHQGARVVRQGDGACRPGPAGRGPRVRDHPR